MEKQSLLSDLIVYHDLFKERFFHDDSTLLLLQLNNVSNISKCSDLADYPLKDVECTRRLVNIIGNYSVHIWQVQPVQCLFTLFGVLSSTTGNNFPIDYHRKRADSPFVYTFELTPLCLSRVALQSAYNEIHRSFALACTHTHTHNQRQDLIRPDLSLIICLLPNCTVQCV